MSGRAEDRAVVVVLDCGVQVGPDSWENQTRTLLVTADTTIAELVAWQRRLWPRASRETFTPMQVVCADTPPEEPTP